MKNLMYIFLILLVSCGGVVPDNGTSISAIKAGVPSVEFDACGSTWKGLAVCTVKPDADLASVNIAVQGYYKGEMRLITSGCPLEIDEKRSYATHEKIKVVLQGSPEKDCLLTVTMSPKYKGWKTKGILIEPIEGHVYIRRTANEKPIIKTSVTKRNVNLYIPSKDPGRVVMRSSFCGADYDQVLKPEKAGLKVSLAQVIDIHKKQLCIINGASVDTNQLILWYASRYDGKYIPLARPSLKMTKRRLKVTASSSVSVLVLNGKYTFSNKKSFKFNRKKKNILRLLTVKGRSQIGVWYPNKGEWLWK